MNKIKSIEHEIASEETNIRWLLGEKPLNNSLIAKHKRQINLLREQLTCSHLEPVRDDHGFFV